MKFKHDFRQWLPAAGLMVCLAGLRAAIAEPSSTNFPSTSAPIQMPNGTADVVKMAHAGVTDDTIIAFVQSKNSQYGLAASDILYLKDQGVSEHVITAMLQNGRNAQQTAPIYSSGTSTAAPPQTYVTSTETAPSSNVYVVPNPEPTYVYQDYYSPGYVWGPDYYYPPVVFGFGFGGRFHDHGFPHAGFRGSFRGGSFGGSVHINRGFGGGFRGGGSFGHRR